MGLKNMFSKVKQEGYVKKAIDTYLLSLNATDNDRAMNVNAPSAIGSCLRARYYSRVGTPKDGSITARTRRIFDNGTYTHIRLQDYLKAEGILLADEIPVVNDHYNIQGHTDGVLQIAENEVAILEIKSINNKGFTELKDIKPEHKRQGLIYAFCLEQRRLELKKQYKNILAFNLSAKTRAKEVTKRYEYFVDGHKFTRQQKIDYQVQLHNTIDKILFKTEKPIDKVVFLYEDKDNQELKEFILNTNSSEGKAILNEMLNECEYLNGCVADKNIPEREGRNKSDQMCRWCDYKNQCWVV